MKIIVPHKYTPRDYQIPVFEAIDNGVKRAVLIMHRRSGKDKTLINLVCKKAHERIGTYYYFFPTYTQGKKILWNGRDRDGMKFMDHIPEEIRMRTDNTDMLVELKCGSLFQVIGTDKFDAVRGSNPVGCVFSEFAYQDPNVWGIIKPILKENGGWAVFNTTPQGKNHAYDLYNMARDNKHWFCQLLTVDDTKREDGKPIFSKQDIKDERDEGTPEEEIQQEYYCSFEAGLKGGYYTQNIELARNEGRWDANVPYDGATPVYTVWDLGIGDSTSIWFIQVVGQEIRVIDCFENSGEGLGYYIAHLKSLPYRYGDHFAPHDIDIREFTTGVSRLQTARNMGIGFRMVEKLSIDDGIDAVRAIFKRCWFDKEKTKEGRNALTAYHKEWDEKRKEFKRVPFHDWSSHYSDAFRYMALCANKMFVGEVSYGEDRVTANQDW